VTDQPTGPPAEVILTDGGVTLRVIDHTDVDQITAACQDERLQRYIPVPRPYERAAAEDYVTRSRAFWPTGRKAVFAIVDAADTGRLLGVIILTVAGRCGNAAYWVVPAARGAGVARRALELLTEWAFQELVLAVILLEIHETNTASMEVARACGYHRAGRIDSTVGPGGHALLYSRLVSDDVLGSVRSS
jgi:RimJ/RimL family protein N-acetyltransferase